MGSHNVKITPVEEVFCPHKTAFCLRDTVSSIVELENNRILADQGLLGSIIFERTSTCNIYVRVRSMEEY